jgi:hypothetical protein
LVRRFIWLRSSQRQAHRRPHPVAAAAAEVSDLREAALKTA